MTGGKLSARVPLWQVCQEVNVECLVGVLRHEWANILCVFLLALMFFVTLLGVERWHARRRFRAHQPPVMKRRTRTTERVTRGDRRGVANKSPSPCRAQRRSPQNAMPSLDELSTLPPLPPLPQPMQRAEGSDPRAHGEHSTGCLRLSKEPKMQPRKGSPHRTGGAGSRRKGSPQTSTMPDLHDAAALASRKSSSTSSISRVSSGSRFYARVVQAQQRQIAQIHNEVCSSSSPAPASYAGGACTDDSRAMQARISQTRASWRDGVHVRQEHAVHPTQTEQILRRQAAWSKSAAFRQGFKTKEYLLQRWKDDDEYRLCQEPSPFDSNAFLNTSVV